jgi:hypothetical protein
MHDANMATSASDDSAKDTPTSCRQEQELKLEDALRKAGTEEDNAMENDKYPKGSRLVALTISLMLSILMVALDTNVIGS